MNRCQTDNRQLTTHAQSDNAQPVSVGQRDDVGLIEEDRLAGLDGQDLGPGLMEILDRGDADGRDVEPHVLLGLGDLDERPAAGAAELAGTFDAAVGSLDRLDGQGGTLLDGDRLTHVEPAHFLGQHPAELNVLLLGRLGAGG